MFISCQNSHDIHVGVEKYRKIAQKKEKNLPFILSLYLSQSNVRLGRKTFSFENDQEILKLTMLLMIKIHYFYGKLAMFDQKNP